MMAGGPETYVFKFKSVKETVNHFFTLTFVYKRPWEQEVAKT